MIVEGKRQIEFGRDGRNDASWAAAAPIGISLMPAAQGCAHPAASLSVDAVGLKTARLTEKSIESHE